MRLRVNNDATKVGYEISFTRYFYKSQPLRTLAQISADILAVEKEAVGLLDGLLMTDTAPRRRTSSPPASQPGSRRTRRGSVLHRW